MSYNNNEYENDYLEENTGSQKRSAAASKSGGRHVKSPAVPEKKSRKKKTGKTVLIILIIFIVVVLIAGVLIFRHFYGMLGAKYKTPEATPAPAVETVTPTPEPTPEPTPTPEPLSEEELAKIAEMEFMASLQESSDEVMQSKDVLNILLVGSDGVHDEALERSDAMILLSINKATKTVWLTSFLRDALINIPNYSSEGHLNWATRFGGIDLLLETMEDPGNFAIHIDNYAIVNFNDFVAIADKLGTISVELSAEEVADINILINQIGHLNNTPKEERPYLAEGGGAYELTNGMQILSYCRERHVGGNTGRGVKQRDALLQMWGNVKHMSIRELYELMNAILPNVLTDLTPSQCASLILMVPDVIDYSIKTQQVPVEGAYWRGRDSSGLGCYYIDYAVTRNFLRATIYNEEMSEKDLISYWTGTGRLVWSPEK